MRQSYFRGLFPALERRGFCGGGLCGFGKGMHLTLTGHNAQRNIVGGGTGAADGDPSFTVNTHSDFNSADVNECAVRFDT